MNWKEIKTSQPTAYNKYFQYPFPQSLRHLYDFFDAEGIIIEIKCFGGVMEFKWNIFANRELSMPYNQTWKTRTEAEEQAFTKAFEILESKLKEPK